MPRAVVVHSGVFTPEDRAGSPYQYLPVDVPAGCAGLTVELAYDRSAGVLDLGCFAPSGFRGWSGGARSRYVITPHAATPGYLPGQLDPGEWSVVLGLHRVPAAGLPWSIKVILGDVDTGAEFASVRQALPPAPKPPPMRQLPAEPGWRWLAGDLHAHTVHSDGNLTIDELAALAVGQGLDYLAVTDHNTVSHHSLLPAAGSRAGLTLLPGQELTTHRGHANAFGDIGWVDFREPADTWVRAVHERGGLLSVNHPLAADLSWREPLTVRPPLAEIWHWTWLDRRWGGPMAWWLAWDALDDRQTIPVGGSDFHRLNEGRLPGQPTTWVMCAEEAGAASPATAGAAILAGLAAGRTAVSAGRQGPVLLRVGDELLAVDAEGAILADLAGRRRLVRKPRASFPAPTEPGPQWLEDDQTGILALCG